MFINGQLWLSGINTPEKPITGNHHCQSGYYSFVIFSTYHKPITMATFNFCLTGHFLELIQLGRIRRSDLWACWSTTFYIPDDIPVSQMTEPKQTINKSLQYTSGPQAFGQRVPCGTQRQVLAAACNKLFILLLLLLLLLLQTILELHTRQNAQYGISKLSSYDNE